MPAGAAEDDLAVGDVVGGAELVQHALGVGDDLDVVSAVRDAVDVERLPCDRLEVRVTPADRHLLLHPQCAGEPALAAEAEETGLPGGVLDHQVDAVGRGDAEADLVAGHHQLLVAAEQPVLGELLEVPVVVALLVVEAHRARPGAADDLGAAPVVLVGGHHVGVVSAESLDVQRTVAEHRDRRAEVQEARDFPALGLLVPQADAPRGQRLQVGEDRRRRVRQDRDLLHLGRGLVQLAGETLPGACLAGARKVQGLHWLGFTACSFTVAVALCAPIRSTPRQAFVIDIVAV